MKKTTLTGFMASLLMATGSAFAAANDDTALTTKKYVDDGLRAVYGRASNTYTKSEADSKFVTSEYASSTYLTQESAAEIYAEKDEVNYEALQNRGVAVDNDQRTIGLDFGSGNTPASGVAYVFQDGVFKQLETVSTWNSDVLTAASASSSGS